MCVNIGQNPRLCVNRRLRQLIVDISVGAAEQSRAEQRGEEEGRRGRELKLGEEEEKYKKRYPFPIVSNLMTRCQDLRLIEEVYF